MIINTVFFAPGISGGSNTSSLSSGHRRAAIILHEIYGINDHIQRAGHEWMTRGFDVYTPTLFPHNTPFRYEQQQEAYRHFSENVGFDPAIVTTLLNDLRAQYETLIVIGYSVGATLAWLSAASGLCDGVICYYGSSIRQYPHLTPLCPALVIIARYEPAFDPLAMRQTLEKCPRVQCKMYDARHGFCNADSATFDAALSHQVMDDVTVFIRDITHANTLSD
ncbi:dienelactone hydrolase family protein [Salmonella enterica subsp. diarizonae]|uniref:Dienelactone hydrolase family protein n=2 Tax=Salmonella enterica TaxID=28901 RepID=A0A3V0PLL2_SALDZ|nr:dienelactone hydrolase family protein [Salmonella enterica]EBH8033294.1 dienelactone hydrolase family protein [Salmonella bongori]ECU8746925.1 dienelactone hydrolase family protein [Salmonella enterica subsp. diarizonae str. CFSAN000558]EDN4535631.1 dienelactone hydrolase family protein [Salmonella enterica subsp. diarizonae serovar 47:k:z35]EDQ3841667.1 dienelactone hydrolase family protein [Salmonella enterica subsp. enterica serovar Bareilly]EHG6068859.1 dienelactone hydrolase family pro